MGEQPIFSCKAHVFHIDPKTKRSWMPASSTAVSVSFFYDSQRGLYRIISVEGTKAVINSTITPNMTFTKTSQKFGQWSDVRANTVYGLGFSSESELQKFIDKFNEVKEATRNAMQKVTANGGTAVTPVTSANASPITARAAATAAGDGSDLLEPPGSAVMPSQNAKQDEHDAAAAAAASQQAPPSHGGGGGRGHSVSTMQPPSNESPSHQAPKPEKGGPYSLGSISSMSSGGGSSGNSGVQADMQLKYENDRLKLALAQSSANAKKWEIELATLKSNNARLTSALQESTANVEEWKRQLHTYKEENMRMKANYQADLEACKGGGEVADDLRKEIQSLMMRIEQLEADLDQKNNEIKQLTVTHKGSDIIQKHGSKVYLNQVVSKLQQLQKENQELQATAKLSQSELEVALGAHDSQRQVLQTLNQQLAGRIQDLVTIHDEINTALQT